MGFLLRMRLRSLFTARAAFRAGIPPWELTGQNDLEAQRPLNEPPQTDAHAPYLLSMGAMPWMGQAVSPWSEAHFSLPAGPIVSTAFPFS